MFIDPYQMESEYVDSCRGVVASQAVENESEQNALKTDTTSNQVPPTSEHTSVDKVVSQTGKKRKLTSPAWDHFDRTVVGQDIWAICKKCKTKLSARSRNGTKSLLNHIETCANAKNQDITQLFEKQKQISVETSSDGNVQFCNYTFVQEKSRKELASAIILHEYTLIIVEHVGFRKFIASLQPRFKMVTRNTIKKYILNIYDIEFENLYKQFEKLKSRIAITTDMWTSNQRKSYMSITAHYIDDSWVLQNRILRFVYVPAPHTKEELARHLMEGLAKWNIETKLSTITVDNCSANDGMISILMEKLYGDLLCDGEVLHMRCCAHILNLVVKDGLSVIDGALEKIRNSVSFWSASSQRIEKFEEMAKQLKIPCTKKLATDCKTRWNSTFLMLKIAIAYKDIFPRLKIRDKLYKDVPSDDDWDLASKVAEKLEVFYTTTELFSGRKYTTSNCFFVSMCTLRNSVVDWMGSNDVVIREMSKKMFTKFAKYWQVVHVVLAVAVVLDPRYKLKVVEFYFPGIYGDDATKEIDQVRQTCYNLVNEYQSKLSKRKQASASVNVNSSGTTSVSTQSTSAASFDKLVEFLSSSRNATNVSLKSELDYYLDEAVLPWTETFDILDWWKTNGIKYPTLQLIARDFLAIPVSTVASESAFSTGGRVVSLHRSRLHPDTLEALMCSQSWLWATLEDGCSTADTSCLCSVEEDDVD